MDSQGNSAPQHGGSDHINAHPAEAVSPDQTMAERQRKISTQYSRRKLLLGLSQSLLLFFFLFAMLVSGVSVSLERLAFNLIDQPYGALLAFALLFGILEGALAFPMRWYSGYVLEHRYGLSNQSIGRWLWESLKGTGVSAVLAVPILLVFYYVLRTYGSSWWIPLGFVLFLFSILLSRIAPVLIFPLFYKFQPLQDGALRERILALTRAVGMRVEGVFVFDMSKNTKKANAAFTGIGKSKRIILGDTLIANFTDEEIETVFAHELGHFKLRHVWVMMVTGMVTVFVGLWIASRLYETSLGWFGFDAIDRIAALPLLGIWLGLYSLVTTPVNNLLSRALERAADTFAVRLTRNGEALVHALQKLGAVNLADPNPHPAIEFFFYSHPSIQKRVERIKTMSAGSPQ
ncbi:MAG: M48 family metallopeptidase [Ignavibacteria bacterium]|nr:M48 family metallopeptidase [Ignavibacteria bacterium]